MRVSSYDVTSTPSPPVMSNPRRERRDVTERSLLTGRGGFLQGWGVAPTSLPWSSGIELLGDYLEGIVRLLLQSSVWRTPLLKAVEHVVLLKHLKTSPPQGIEQLDSFMRAFGDTFSTRS